MCTINFPMPAETNEVAKPFFDLVVFNQYGRIRCSVIQFGPIIDESNSNRVSCGFGYTVQIETITFLMYPSDENGNLYSKGAIRSEAKRVVEMHLMELRNKIESGSALEKEEAEKELELSLGKSKF